ncbi:MAG: hypothetical protein AB8B85_09750 [Paracoccaceae bacterium]
MRTLHAILIATLLSATPVAADETSTMEDRLQETLRGLLDEMKPALDDALDETMKFLGAFSAIDDPRHYDLPEVLSNGDIIIRRRSDAPDYRAPEPDKPEAEGGTIDL